MLGRNDLLLAVPTLWRTLWCGEAGVQRHYGRSGFYGKLTLPAADVHLAVAFMIVKPRKSMPFCSTNFLLPLPLPLGSCPK